MSSPRTAGTRNRLPRIGTLVFVRGAVPVGLVALFACGRPAAQAAVQRGSHLDMHGVTFTKICIDRSVWIHGELVTG